MHAETVIDRISQELLANDSIHTLLLYGSYADGSSGPGSDYDIAARKVWAYKMVTRIERNDPEGNYRRAWLHQVLMEDFFFTFASNSRRRKVNCEHLIGFTDTFHAEPSAS